MLQSNTEQKPMLNKIISGGQTGADQAGLDAAIYLRIPHGGWIPKGRRTEAGPLSAKYDLREMPFVSYPKRTEKNVLDSDATLIISHGKLTGGSRLTVQLAQKHCKPYLHLDLKTLSVTNAAGLLAFWLAENKIKILNVAGPRASEDPAVYRATFQLLVSALKA